MELVLRALPLGTGGFPYRHHEVTYCHTSIINDDLKGTWAWSQDMLREANGDSIVHLEAQLRQMSYFR
jgi:hypothetical protein